MIKAKDYLTEENRRNRRGAELFTDMLHKAFGDDVDVIIGHHLTFERTEGKAEVSYEVPSADALMFCHDIMSRVFGGWYIEVMRELAAVPVEARDGLLAGYFYDPPWDKRAPAMHPPGPSPINGGPIA